MVRNAETASIHLRLITAVVNHLLSKGYKVSADHVGFPNGIPEAWNGYIPDIDATKDGKRIYFEAETCDSLNYKETKEQWEALSARPNVDFFVIVPQKCLSEAKKLAKEWNVKITEFWTMDV